MKLKSLDSSSSEKQLSELVHISLSWNTVARTCALCKARGLPFPEGINFLLNEVAKPRCARTSTHTNSHEEHTGHMKSAVKKSRATGRRVRPGL